MASLIRPAAEIREGDHHDLTPGFLPHLLDQNLHDLLLAGADHVGEVVDKTDGRGNLKLEQRQNR